MHHDVPVPDFLKVFFKWMLVSVLWICTGVVHDCNKSQQKKKKSKRKHFWNNFCIFLNAVNPFLVAFIWCLAQLAYKKKEKKKTDKSEVQCTAVQSGCNDDECMILRGGIIWAETTSVDEPCVTRVSQGKGSAKLEKHSSRTRRCYIWSHHGNAFPRVCQLTINAC